MYYVCYMTVKFEFMIIAKIHFCFHYYLIIDLLYHYTYI